jgi:predicted secreted protein
MLTGAINGTKVLLKRKMSDGTQLVIGALVSNSSNYQRNALDITTKSDPDFRQMLDGDEGTKTIDHNVEVLFSSDTAYQAMRNDYFTGDIVSYFLVLDDSTDNEAEFKFKVTNFADENAQNASVSTSVTLTSSDSFERIIELVRAIDTNLDYAVDSNGVYAISNP